MRTSTTTLRVRYAETDQMGVVYHANYLVWFEVGRTDLLRQLGWTYREMEKTGVRLPVIEVECTYRSPARYDDEIEVRTTGRLLSGVRVEFTYEAVVTPGGISSAVGVTRHAAVNLDGRPCRLPERIREAFL
ncbi:MAG TPA: thioesterase family protein [Vicinamibacterales bacterium]|jgi:acyl-CoA thioester hydrolase|nr:acyl-CoA thioesterase [Acidobacteriota bacterium]HQX81111.1 thioesterase family protein [Vicinamibacterales bacterium]